MDALLAFAQGPLFRGCVIILLLGMLRVIALTLAGMADTLRRARVKRLPFGRWVRETLSWFFPWGHSRNTHPVFSVIVLFHVGFITVPLFYSGHALLWRSGTGIAPPMLDERLAAVLTLTTIGAAFILLLVRLFHRNARGMSGAMDYLLVLLVLAIFTTGFMASKPYNPMDYKTTLLLHVLCGDLFLALMPFTKAVHCVLFPLFRLAANIAWRYSGRGAGEVTRSLYGEEARKL
jgi:nitrate reductase gamma subunit